jgi:tetratricopeptide (TPR) repeat protein
MNDLAEMREVEDLHGAHQLEGDPEDWLSLLAESAHYLLHRGQYQQARELHEQVLAGRQGIMANDHPDILAAMNNLAATRWALGDLDGARHLHEQALADCRRVLSEDHPDTLSSMNNLARTRRALGDLDGACKLHEQAPASYRRVLGEHHPDTLTAQNKLAEVRRCSRSCSPSLTFVRPWPGGKLQHRH